MIGLGVSLPQHAARYERWWPHGATLMLDFVNSRAMLADKEIHLDSILSISRASTSYVKTANGQLVQVGDDLFARSNLGLQIEAGATNLLSYSQSFDNAWWDKMTNITVTADTLNAPDVTTTADTLTKSTTDTLKALRRQSITVTNSSDYTFSVFARADTLNKVSVSVSSGSHDTQRVIDLSDNSITTGAGDSGTGFVAVNVENYVNGWKRIVLTTTAGATSMDVAIYPGDMDVSTTGDVSIWGAQLEEGNIATSYIPTTTTSASRSADDIAFDSVSWLDPASAGTFVAQAYTKRLASDASLFYLLRVRIDGTNRIEIYNHSLAGEMLGVVTAANATQTTLGGTYTASTPFKIAFAYDTDDAAASFDGGTVTTDTTVTLPSGTPAIALGSNLFSNYHFNGVIQSLAYFDTRQSDGSLVELASI